MNGALRRGAAIKAGLKISDFRFMILDLGFLILDLEFVPTCSGWNLEFKSRD